jgi:hypothetical protein
VTKRDDWEPGDLALCVKARFFPDWVGRLFTVSDVLITYNVDTHLEGVGLRFVGTEHPLNARLAFCATYFRKVTPGAEIKGIEAEKRRVIPQLVSGRHNLTGRGA